MKFHRFSYQQEQHSASNPELEALILCARTQVDAQIAEQIRTSIHPVDWYRLLQQAAYHGVLPLVYNTLNKTASDLAPKEVLNQFREHYISNTFRVLDLVGELVKIVQYLESQDITVVPFKGPTLAFVAYQSLDARSFSDLDLLVLLPDYFRLKEMLASQDYIFSPYLLGSKQKTESYYLRFGEYSMVHREKQIHLDIHHTLLGGDWLKLSSDLTRFWNRLVPVSIAGTTIMSLRPEDLLLYLCINGTKDCWLVLRLVCDITELIRSHPNLQWNTLIQEAKELRIERILRSGLLISHNLFGTSLPSEVLDYAQVDTQAKWLADRVCKRLRGQLPSLEQSSMFEKVMFRCIAVEYWRAQLKYCLSLPLRTISLFFTLNYRDKEFLPLPRSFYFLYYLIRPIRLLKDHGLQVIRLALP